MRVMVTGHRPQRLKGKEDIIKGWLEEQLKDLNPELCISGMAQGVDQIYAQVAENFNIPLVCAFPYKRTSFHQTEIDIMDKAAYINFISDKYSKESYYVRDKWMVDNSDIVLVVWDGIETGGTYITMEYAKKCNKEMRIFKV